MRALVSHLQLVIAILVVMLAAGRGLPGIVSALHAEPSHVCTCASGGDHASCPVCNRTLTEHRRSSRPEASGIPCGTGRLAVTASGDVGTLPGAVGCAVRPVERVAALRAPDLAIGEVLLEPATPPPRLAAT
jgi:hypothetical protein